MNKGGKQDVLNIYFSNTLNFLKLKINMSCPKCKHIAWLTAELMNSNFDPFLVKVFTLLGCQSE